MYHFFAISRMGRGRKEGRKEGGKEEKKEGKKEGEMEEGRQKEGLLKLYSNIMQAIIFRILIHFWQFLLSNSQTLLGDYTQMFWGDV